MNIKLVVFDMAGTTVRDDDAVNHCLSQALATAGIQATRDEINEVMGMPKPVAIGALLERHKGRGGLAAADIHDEFQRRMIDFYSQSADVEPMPHTVEVFQELKVAGIKITLDTGFSRPIVDVILRRLQWDKGTLLDATVTSDEVARGRPHPDLIWRAMELTAVTDCASVAKVGDTPSDLMEGMAAGCGLVVGVTNGSHTREQLAPHRRTHLIASLAELPPLLLASAKRSVDRCLSAGQV